MIESCTVYNGELHSMLCQNCWNYIQYNISSHPMIQIFKWKDYVNFSHTSLNEFLKIKCKLFCSSSEYGPGIRTLFAGNLISSTFSQLPWHSWNNGHKDYFRRKNDNVVLIEGHERSIIKSHVGLQGTLPYLCLFVRLSWDQVLGRPYHSMLTTCSLSFQDNLYIIY
jgi:hypothetical protein